MKRAISRSSLVCSIAALAAVALITGALTSRSAAGATGKEALGVYSIATAVQYINNADDEARGVINNPFDAKENKLRPHLTFNGSGPFAGDVTVFSFKLYDSPKLKNSTGSASYTCYYNYNKEALCDAYLEIDGRGTLVASGPVDFNATQYTLIVTGGTNDYLGVRGEVTATPVASQNAQHLNFVLLK